MNRRLGRMCMIMIGLGIASYDVNTVGGELAAPVQTSFNHLCNARRTGFTPTELPPPYHLAWTYRSRHKPRPAWREPAWESQRIDMDYAYPLAADAGSVYVASSSDHAIHALDLGTGRPRWRFFTEGPIRLAPTVHRGRVYVSSDDGYAVCVDSDTGQLIWKYRPDIPHERLIGNEQVINRWPARSGVLVDGNRAYTTFGMWSTEGIVIACLDAQTGEAIWQNDSSGTRYMTQPHYEAMGGVSPQGSLALCGDVLVVPCGRAAPGFFDAKTGRLLYNEAEGLFPGGAWTMTFGALAFTPCEFLKKPNPVAPDSLEAEICDEASLVALHARTGEEVFHLHGALRGVIDNDGQMSLIGPKKLVGVALQDVLQAAPGGYEAKRGSSEGHFVEVDEHKRWETPVERVFALIQAGSTLIAGGRDELTCYRAVDGNKLWETHLQGDVRQLLIARESLLVSTTEGEVHCFRVGPRLDEPKLVRSPKRKMTPSFSARKRVTSVLAASDVGEGYGLILGNVDVDYLVALADQSNLVWHWAAGTRDANAIRLQLADEGLYGTRIVVHNVASDPLPYANYSMNLLVFEVGSATELKQTSASEVYRVTRPCGGAAVIHCNDDVGPAVDRWLAAGNLPEHTRRDIDGGVCIQRGPLPGAGVWTHQYADAGKSGASSDQLVRLPLKTLWFGGVGPADIISRHYRAPAPLAINGRLFVAGIDYLHAVDAYNGRILWQRKLPGVGRWPAAYRGGCIAADDDAVYALMQENCLRLDPDSGQTLLTYRPPDTPIAAPDGSNSEEEFIWEYLAVTDNAVVGTIGQPHVRRSWWSMAHPANRLLFVLDKTTGKTRWTYRPESAVDSSAIAIEGQRLFLIDGLAAADVFRAVRRGEGRKQQNPRPVFSLPGASHARALKCFDLSSGSLVWETTDVGGRQNSLFVSDGVILSSTPIWHGLRAKREGPNLSAFAAEDGQLLWSRERQATLPVIVNSVAYLPEACNLRTGKPIMRRDPLTGQMAPFSASVTGGCAQLAGCENALMKRSGSMGFFDLSGRSGVYHFPNMRASCWVNMVPACGLVLVPEGSSSCPCAYNYKTSVALMPAERHNHWGLYTSSPRRRTQRIEKLCLNFGAPGDKQRAVKEDVWFAFPRPSTTGPRGAGGMGRVPYDTLPMVSAGENGDITPLMRNPDWITIAGTDQPWLYTCGLVGPLELQVDLAPEGTPARDYRVTLHFCELRNTDRAGSFNVLLQGQTVLTDLNVTEQAGGRARPLTKQLTVTAADQLTLKLEAQPGSPPIISAMQIEAVLSHER